MTVDRAGCGGPAGRAAAGQCAGSLRFRCAPVLDVQQSQLVEFLARGHRYDRESVAVAVREGNDLFDARDSSRAFDAYGVAYELARLTFDYRPLLYDLLIRRAICRSMLGDVEGALAEVSLAERVVPHESAIHLLRGLLHMKLGAREVASHCLLQAAIQNRELRDLVESFVGLCWLRWGECDKAVKVCSRVLSRAPACPLALLARRDAYRYHPSGRFARQAEADAAAAAALGAGLPARLGQRLDASEPCQLDELLLHFHPSLREQGGDDGPVFHHRYRR
ncbi:unnamed protein product [Prorocentrum cordatum]|uniref:Uncharacterized protein n=1 Tax=Prorocentrum cordatum TaxID=2364126 RepID=A0ABN9WVW9_9DINO|nr:unnamed protein product [Polarella glacialis]